MFDLKKFYINYQLTVCLIISVYFLVLIISLSNSGLDITDEGSYLNLILNPDQYKTITQSGFVYNSFFILLDYNIASLRKINLLTNFFLSYWLFFLLFKRLIKINFYYNQALLITLSMVSFLSIHSLTPNYNSLAFQGLLITCIGILSIEYKKNIGCLLIGIGGWLVFMGKPTSIVALSIILLIYFIGKKNSFNTIVLSSTVGVILILITSVMIDGSPITFIKRFLEALSHVKIFSSVYGSEIIFKKLTSVVRDYNAQNLNSILYTFLSIIVICFIFYYVTFAKFINIKSNLYFKIIFFTLIVFLLIFINFYHFKWINIFDRYQRLQIFAILSCSIFAALKFNQFKLKNVYENLQLKLIFLFLSLPFVYAFGTGSNVLKKSLDAGIFYFIVSLIIIIPSIKKKNNINYLVLFSFLSLLISCIHINWIIENPIRQTNSLKLNNYIINYNEDKNFIKLNKSQGEYIYKAKIIAKDAGLKKGDHILDLTGKSPGLIFLLDANSLGAPWMIGGYPGSLEFAKAKIQSTSCEKISKSWIMHDNFSRNISLDILKSYGSDINLDYVEIGIWKSSIYKGSFKQKLFKPVDRNVIYNKCNNARK